MDETVPASPAQNGLSAPVPSTDAGCGLGCGLGGGRWQAQLERMGGVGAWACVPETGEIEASDKVHDLLGLAPGTALSIEMVLARLVSPKARVVLRQRIERVARTHVPTEFETSLRTPDGRLRRIRLVAEADARQGRFTRILGVMHDITRQYEDQQKLWQAAHIDDLTGLANRRWFLRRLQAAVEAGQPLALALVDLNSFTAINDQLGAQAADALLQEIAGRFARLVRPSGLAARLAGDEFALLVAQTEPDQAAQRLADQARVALEALGRAAGVRLTASVGMASLPDDATDAEGLLRCARQALAEVKQIGLPGAAAFLRGPTRDRFEARRRAVACVQAAAREGRIGVHYQPKIRLDNGSLAGHEALARIVTTDGRICGPEDWGMALDDEECARLVDATVFEAVLNDLARDDGRLARVGVNFSEASLRGADFADRVLRAVAQRGLAPDLLELEVVETVLVGRRVSALSFGFARLRAAGMRITLDDFGTGFASLSHLRDLPIDRIKLDKSFVLGLDEDRRNAPILRAVVELAHALGLETVAEGVETAEAVAFLRALACGEGQGFHFGPPQPFEALARR